MRPDNTILFHQIRSPPTLDGLPRRHPVAWGDCQDDWDTLCVCSGSALDGPTIVVFWLGQEAHEQVIALSKKLMSSNWDGKPETVPEILEGRSGSSN